MNKPQGSAIIPISVNGNQESTVIQYLQTAKTALAEAQTVEDVSDTRQKFNAVEALSKKFHLSKGQQIVDKRLTKG